MTAAGTERLDELVGRRCRVLGLEGRSWNFEGDKPTHTHRQTHTRKSVPGEEDSGMCKCQGEQWYVQNPSRRLKGNKKRRHPPVGQMQEWSSGAGETW